MIKVSNPSVYTDVAYCSELDTRGQLQDLVASLQGVLDTVPEEERSLVEYVFDDTPSFTAWYYHTLTDAEWATEKAEAEKDKAALLARVAEAEKKREAEELAQVMVFAQKYPEQVQAYLDSRGKDATEA